MQMLGGGVPHVTSCHKGAGLLGPASPGLLTRLSFENGAFFKEGEPEQGRWMLAAAESSTGVGQEWSWGETEAVLRF